MRIDIKKFLFLGLEEDRNRFFQKAQELGIIQFIDVKGARSREMPEDLQKLNAAITIVRGLEPREQEEEVEESRLESIVDRILELKQKVEVLFEEQRVTRLEIARIHIFGDFSLEDIRAIEKEGDRKIQFFCAREGEMEKSDIFSELIYIGTGQGLDYFISISKERKQYENMIEMHIEESSGDLQKRLKESEKMLHQVEHELRSYARYNTFLHHALIGKLNDFHLQTAKEFPKETMDGALFAVEGWIPADKAASLNELNVYAEEIAIGPDDPVPTHLENQGVARIGEDLVHFYDTPSSSDKDPSLWVVGFFSLFYAIIIGDAAYGAIFLLAALYFYYKTPKLTHRGKRLMKLVVILSSACIVWGVLINSYFGIKIAPENPLRKISLLQWLVNKKADYHVSLEDAVYNEWLVKYPQPGKVNNYTDFLQIHSSNDYEILSVFTDNILLELALLIGTVHICFSLLRYLDRNWAAAGWILAIIGAYLYIPYYMNSTSMIHFVLGLDKAAAAATGKYLFFGGVSLAVVTSLIQNRWSGLLEITLVIQIFSDILSYLRLFALGLSGGIISVTLNEIAGVFPLVFGILLLIIGHTVNMVLCIMGGVIHGLRLNFLEWYHYSFQGGGKQFSPLCKVEIE